MARARPVMQACRTFWRLYMPVTTGPGTSPPANLAPLSASIGDGVRHFWQGQRGKLLERIPYATIGALGLGLSLAAFFMVQTLHQTATQKAFEGPAGRYATAIIKALDSNIAVVKSAGSFFSAANDANRWEFFQFARAPLPRHPAIQAVEWIPRVRAEDRAYYEEQALEDGLFGFRFTEPGANGKAVTAAARAEHYPIYFIEPFLNNEANLGHDMAADPATLAMLEQVRDSGQMVVAWSHQSAAGPKTGGTQEQTTLEVILPVYETNAVPAGRSERRVMLLGFLRSVIHLEALVASAHRQQSGTADLEVAIFDRADPTGGPVFRRPPLDAKITATGVGAEGKAPTTGGLELISHHQVGTQRWSILITPGQGWQAPAQSIGPWSVLVVGLLLTAIMAQYLVTTRERTRIIKKAVNARTAELNHLNKVLAQEICERKQAETELRTAKDKAEIASRAKSEFLAMMGHELRTPLNAVIGFADILSHETFGPLGDPRYRDYVADIGRSGQDLLSIINDILDLTTIESEDFHLKEETVNIADLVTLACEETQAKAVEAGLSLSAKVTPKTPPLKANRQAVTRILQILISNALKFTPQGGRIHLTTELDGSGGVLLEVVDDGIGIAPKDQERVFLPFTQVDQTLSRRHEGTGLGLTLALRLVELHGGTMSLLSQLGEGTRVRVVFPAARSLTPRALAMANKPERVAYRVS